MSSPACQCIIDQLGSLPFDLTAAGSWSQEERGFNINMLEMKVVVLALNAFLDRVTRDSVVLNATFVAYLKKQGGGHRIEGVVQSGTGNCDSVRGSFNSSPGKVHA